MTEQQTSLYFLFTAYSLTVFMFKQELEHSILLFLRTKLGLDVELQAHADGVVGAASKMLLVMLKSWLFMHGVAGSLLVAAALIELA